MNKLWLPALALTSTAFACGGVDQLPPPPPPPPAMPVSATTPTAALDAGPSEPIPEPPVLFMTGAAAPAPTDKVMPSVSITAPTKGQILAAAHAADTAIKVDAKGATIAPTGNRVHVVLDGKATHTVTDLKAPFTLGALAGPAPLPEGPHFITATLARATGESFVHKEASTIMELYVGKKSAPAVGTVDVHKPLIVLNLPGPTVADADADHVLVDFIVLNAQVGDARDAKDGKERVRVAFKLEGPGIDGALTATTTRVVPYYMDNLRAGSYTLRAQLLGKDGKDLSGAGATTTRTITVTRGVAKPAAGADAGAK